MPLITDSLGSFFVSEDSPRWKAHLAKLEKQGLAPKSDGPAVMLSLGVLDCKPKPAPILDLIVRPIQPEVVQACPIKWEEAHPDQVRERHGDYATLDITTKPDAITLHGLVDHKTTGTESRHPDGRPMTAHELIRLTANQSSASAFKFNADDVERALTLQRLAKEKQEILDAVKPPKPVKDKPLELEPAFNYVFTEDVYGDDRLHPEQCVSIDLQRPYGYQVVGVDFATLSAHGRCIINDDTGLGKTVQGLLWIACNRVKAGRYVIITKAKLKYQWAREAMRWLGTSEICQIIDGANDYWMPGMKGYIVSYDTCGRIKDLQDKFKSVGVETLILDEVQMIKNEDSARGEQVRESSRIFKNIISLSATPIKNNAGEYWNVLNIVRPDMFPDKNQFIMNDCAAVSNGYGWKVGGLHNPDAFREKTKSFIIRRLREDVLPDLPRIKRDHRFFELGKEVEQEYRRVLQEFNEAYDDCDQEDSMTFAETGNIMGYISKMRHIVGLAKVKPTIDFLEDFLEETNRPFTVFIHHKDVAQLMEQRLLIKGIKPLMGHSGLNPQQSQKLVDDFRFGVSRVAILSTLAYGEGANLQFCSDCAMSERQWNPANEEQAEGRFPRPGNTADRINATYFVATGTVDEFLAEIVEKKREYMGNTLDGYAIQWNQTSIMKELAATLRANGGKKWGWK